MTMNILQQLSCCVEFGKINKQSPFPPQMKGEDGAEELTLQAIAQGISAQNILEKGLMDGMHKVGVKFRDNQIFVPQVLMSAKAMSVATAHLKPFYTSGDIQSKGTFIIGTVTGDLHDIGKNIVSMIVEGNGYKVIDLGVDVPSEKFIETLHNNPDGIIGLSALLTTTMANMQQITRDIKEQYPSTIVAIGGAPVTQEFCDKIGADIYSANPQELVDALHQRLFNK